MKKALKITFGAILAVGMTAPAFAHARHHHYDEVLDHTAVWVAGTYTKTSNNGLSVGDQLFAPDVSANNFDGGRRATFLEPGYEWDYMVGGRYHIPRSNGTVYINYDHWNADDSRGDTNLVNIGLNPGLPILPANVTVSEARVDQSFNEFRLGYAHALHFSDRFCLDLGLFFEYDRVKRDLHEEIRQSTDFHSRDTQNKVRGYGPGIGAKGRLYMFRNVPCWSVFAGINHALLYAREDFDQVYYRGPDFAYQYSPEQSKSIVGKMDIDFGIEYARPCGFGGTMLDIALGFRMMNMYNGFKNGNTAWNPPIGDNPAGGVALGIDNFAANTGKPEDIGRWGPYIKFTLGGAHS